MYQLPSVDFLCSASLKVRLVGVDVWIPVFWRKTFQTLNPSKKTPKKIFLDLSNQKKTTSHRILPKNLRSQRVAYRSGWFANGTWWESVTWIWSLFFWSLFFHAFGHLGGGLKPFCVYPYLWKIPILTNNIFFSWVATTNLFFFSLFFCHMFLVTVLSCFFSGWEKLFKDVQKQKKHGGLLGDLEMCFGWWGEASKKNEHHI